MSNQPVYSTKTGSQRGKSKGVKQSASKKTGYQAGTGPAKMRLESKGRSGKAVTVLWNIACPEEQARHMMKEMQNQFGCGATMKGSDIELQGDRRDQIEAYFAAKGLTVKRAGG